MRANRLQGTERREDQASREKLVTQRKERLAALELQRGDSFLLRKGAGKPKLAGQRLTYIHDAEKGKVFSGQGLKHHEIDPLDIDPASIRRRGQQNEDR